MYKTIHTPHRKSSLVLLTLILFVGTVLAQQNETHIVRRGDTLYGISIRYDLSVGELRRLNNLRGNLITVGQTLIIRSHPQTMEEVVPEVNQPVQPAILPDSSAQATTDRPATDIVPGDGSSYIVKQGDTLFSIAARFGTTAYILYTLNGGTSDVLIPGQILLLPDGIFTGTTYTVRRGDTLIEIARRFDVSLATLRGANNIRGNMIRVGQELRIPAGSPDAPIDAPEGGLPPVYAEGPVLPYPETFSGRLTASGSPYDPGEFTVSHQDLPFGTIVLIEHMETGRFTFAEVKDRGPLDDSFIMDVSTGVAHLLGVEADSTQHVRVRIIE